MLFPVTFEYRMTLVLSFLLINCVYYTESQNISQLIMTDTRITKFYQLINKNSEILDYFNNPNITILVPSDDAFNDLKLDNIDTMKLLSAHMFISKKQPGLTKNWNTYEPVKFLDGRTYYNIQSVNTVNQLFLYKTEKFYCNDAKVLHEDILSGNQVYHIIDRVLISYSGRSFMNYLESNASLSKSLYYWKQLNSDAEKNRFSVNPGYQSDSLDFPLANPGMVLVPTNAAWDKLDKSVLTSFDTEYDKFASIMNRYFISGNMIFLRNENVEFNFGFKPSTSKGSISKNLKVNIQGFTANVIRPNIPFKYGCIHIIDDAMVSTISVANFLNTHNKVFVDKISKFPNMTQYLSGNYTILAVDDVILNTITDEVQLSKVLLNSFIEGNVQLKEGPGRYYHTLGNLTIRLRMTNGNYYIDTVRKSAKNTYIHVANVLSLNEIAEQTFITRINGTISDTPMSCDSMLLSMNNSLYQSLLTSNHITLNVGSPYTLFVPGNSALTNFLNQTEYRDQKSKEVRYVIQRMIIANELNLATKQTGNFRAATMNYAAMREMVGLSISSNNCTISFNNVQESFSFEEGGYYCDSNKNDESRFNLIYPVDFVLLTDLKGVNICVKSPCSSSRSVGINIIFLLCTSFVLFIKQFGI